MYSSHTKKLPPINQQNLFGGGFEIDEFTCLYIKIIEGFEQYTVLEWTIVQAHEISRLKIIIIVPCAKCYNTKEFMKFI